MKKLFLLFAVVLGTSLYLGAQTTQVSHHNPWDPGTALGIKFVPEPTQANELHNGMSYTAYLDFGTWIEPPFPPITNNSFSVNTPEEIWDWYVEGGYISSPSFGEGTITFTLRVPIVPSSGFIRVTTSKATYTRPFFVVY